MSLKIGDLAPDFKLFNTQKKEVALSEYRGKNVILLFFPFAFSGTCTAELCHMRDEITTYNDLNAVIFGISNDSVFSMIKYKEVQNLNFELLSDFNKVVSAVYESLYADFIFGTQGVTKRSAFVIDKNGRIQYKEILENASLQPNYDNIKACLEKFN